MDTYFIVEHREYSDSEGRNIVSNTPFPPGARSAEDALLFVGKDVITVRVPTKSKEDPGKIALEDREVSVSFPIRGCFSLEAAFDTYDMAKEEYREVYQRELDDYLRTVASGEKASRIITPSHDPTLPERHVPRVGKPR